MKKPSKEDLPNSKGKKLLILWAIVITCIMFWKGTLFNIAALFIIPIGSFILSYMTIVVYLLFFNEN